MRHAISKYLAAAATTIALAATTNTPTILATPTGWYWH